MINRFFFFYQWTDEKKEIERTASISIEPGWYDLLWEISLNIEKELARIRSTIKHRFIIQEVYEQYGGMTFRYTYYNDSIERILLEAENKSNEICQICGQYGKLREEGDWILTLCDECNSKRRF